MVPGVLKIKHERICMMKTAKNSLIIGLSICLTSSFNTQGMYSDFEKIKNDLMQKNKEIENAQEDMFDAIKDVLNEIKQAASDGIEKLDEIKTERSKTKKKQTTKKAFSERDQKIAAEISKLFEEAKSIRHRLSGLTSEEYAKGIAQILTRTETHTVIVNKNNKIIFSSEAELFDDKTSANIFSLMASVKANLKNLLEEKLRNDISKFEDDIDLIIKKLEAEGYEFKRYSL